MQFVKIPKRSMTAASISFGNGGPSSLWIAKRVYASTSVTSAECRYFCEFSQSDSREGLTSSYFCCRVQRYYRGFIRWERCHPCYYTAFDVTPRPNMARDNRRDNGRSFSSFSLPFKSVFIISRATLSFLRHVLAKHGQPLYDSPFGHKKLSKVLYIWRPSVVTKTWPHCTAYN